MIKRIYRLLPALWVTVAAGSCNYFPEDAEPSIAATTFYDTSADFSRYHTFALTDSIACLQITDKGLPEIVYRKERSAKNQVIIQATLEKLLSYCGLEQVEPNLDVRPDLVVDLLYMDVEAPARHFSDWWPYYGYWRLHEWYFPYHPVYPMAIPPCAKGTLIVDIKDLKHADFSAISATPAVAVWTGVIEGLHDGAYNDTQMNDALRNCFTQTPAFVKMN